MNGAMLRRWAGAISGSVLVTMLLAAPASATSTPTARAALSLSGAFTVQRNAVTVSGRAVAFRGVVRPFASGQHSIIRVYLGTRLIKLQRLAIKRSRGGTFGYFTGRVA